MKSEKAELKTKIDPSFKSKRYRDKLRTEIKTLEGLLPIDRTMLSRKLDSQTVFRLVIAYFRSKIFFKAAGFYDDHAIPPSGHGVEKDDDSDLIDGKSAIQVLDGFLLLLTTDGTILYVSENILQYLGYNQVDLMHRCLYGIVHPDDHYELKTVLENTLTNRHLQNTEGECSDKNGADSNDSKELRKAVSFISRMKCFSGTSAGYLKIHCSGKIVDLSDECKSKRMSNEIAFLYCHPFMLNITELADDIRQNVFWTKHAMDLKIKEVDTKASHILGYEDDELNGCSFYSLIHAEDTATCLACHKALLGSSDIQTIYYRIQSKKGTWVWLQSRGKVISKNCKKFSIVFSHCPVREEDSTYIQKEIVLRQRFAVNDLMCMIHFGQYSTTWKDCHKLSNGTEDPNFSRFDGMQHQFTDGSSDVSVSVQCPLLMPCPSNWHSLTDRHSPILPSSHIAHKISQREKQLQFQEFKRRQQLEQHCPQAATPQWNDPFTRNSSQSYDGVMDSRAAFGAPLYQSVNSAPDYSSLGHGMPAPRHTYENQTFNTAHYPGLSVPQQYGIQIPQWSPTNPYDPSVQCMQANISFLPNAKLYMYTNINIHTIPPSPPPSPMGMRHSYNYIYSSNQNMNSYSQRHQIYLRHQENKEPPHPAPFNNLSQGNRNVPRYTVNQRAAGLMLNEIPQITSEMCQPSLPSENMLLTHPVPSCAIATSNSCTLQMEKSPPKVELDQHMSIVEPSKPPEDREYVDLPSIGSFLEYLNEV